MLRHRALWICCALWLGCLARPAQAVDVVATVDRNHVALGEEMMLTVTVQGDRHAKVTLPALPGFRVAERGQSTQVRIVNGSLSTEFCTIYTLMPTQVGTFMVGAVAAHSRGSSDVFSEPFEVTVTAAPTLRDGEAPGDVAFVTADVSQNAPYVGQQVLYTWRFFRRVPTGQGHVTLPNFDGFSVRELGGQRDYTRLIGGQQYSVTEMQRALFAQEPGEVVVPEAHLEVDIHDEPRRRGLPQSPFGDLFGAFDGRKHALATQPLRLEVRPLPSPPDGQPTILVGHFTITAQLADARLQVGDSTTLTIVIAGDGHVERAVEPHLGAPESLKIYSDRPTLQTQVQANGVVGQKTFKKALVPTAAGAIRLPTMHLTYFDPTANAYQTATTAPLTLDVAPDPHAPPPAPAAPPPSMPGTVEKTHVQLLHDEILPPYRGPAALAPAWQPTASAVWALFGVPTAAYATAWCLRRRGVRRRDDVLMRRQLALRLGLREVAQMQRALAQQDVRTAAQLASRALRDFLGSRLGRSGLALTPQEARALLDRHGVAPPLGEAVEGMLRRCEAAQYGATPFTPPHHDSVAELRDMLHKLHKLLPA